MAKQFKNSVKAQREDKKTEMSGDELACTILIDRVNHRMVAIIYNKWSNVYKDGQAMDF